MDNIDVFNNSAVIIERKNPPKIVSWLSILIISIILFFIIATFYKYEQYLYYTGTVIKEGEKYYVVLYIESDKIPILSNSELLINGNKLKYSIKSISDNYYLINQSDKMYEVMIDCQLKEKLMLDNNIVELSFISAETTVLNKIINNIKKELS